jgi:hypothetical protein
MAAESHPAHRREQLGLFALVSYCSHLVAVIGRISSGACRTQIDWLLFSIIHANKCSSKGIDGTDVAFSSILADVVWGEIKISAVFFLYIMIVKTKI